MKPNDNNMNNGSDGAREEIDAQRLCNAASLILRACVEFAEEHNGRWPYPPALLGAPDQPRAMCDLTRFEVEEGTAFLIRLGILESPKVKAK